MQRTTWVRFLCDRLRRERSIGDRERLRALWDQGEAAYVAEDLTAPGDAGAWGSV